MKDPCRRSSCGWLPVLLAAAWLHAPGAARADGPIVFQHMPAGRTAIAFQHSDGSGGERYIVETVASGLATFDYDGDGRIDIYFLSGAPLPGTEAAQPPKNRLYRNLGGWKFADVTDQAGVGDTGYGLGVAVADYDNDGLPDIYISNFGANVFYRNQGDGTFRDVTDATGTAAADPTKAGAGAAFLDIDADGRLDLFVANYLRFSFGAHAPRLWQGIPIYRGPEFYPPYPSHLFRNQGDGTFRDVSEESGIGAAPGYGMGVICADYNGDGATDIFVANDSVANFLWKNDGKGRFRDVGLESGIAFDFNGDAHGNMGVECGDYNNDGLLDFYVTAYQNQLATLFANFGHGYFQDATLTASAGTRKNVTWGSGMVDFDNDGDKDLFIVCGHLYDNVDRFDDTTSYEAYPVVLRNLGNGRFVNVTTSAGDGLRVKSVGRGVAFDDLDNDGDIDGVILNSRRVPTVLRNVLQENGSKNHWLQIELQGVKTNRDGVGACVRVVAGDLAQIDEVHSGRGYQSHWGSRLHFGLGKHNRVDRIEVRWIGGGTDVLQDVPVDRLMTIREGTTP